MKNSLFIFAILALGNSVFAQGFVNLNFETTTITTVNFPGGNRYTATLPGWTGFGGNFVNGDPNSVALNDIALDAPAVTLHGTNSIGYPAINGKYSILLQSGSKYSPGSSHIGQTAQIPSTALSLTYWGVSWNNLQITFNGQPLSFLTLSNSANFTIYATDISSYAGQTGELLFTAPAFAYYIDGYGPVGGSGMIDKIQFSSTAVPEPGELALVVLGTLVLGFLRWGNYV